MQDNIITVTEVGDYKRCHLLWHFAHQKRIVPVVESPYFAIGRIVHETLHDWTDEPDKPIEQIYAGVVSANFELTKERYKEIVGVEMSEPEENAWLSELVLPQEMVHNYATYWQTPLPFGFRVIKGEQACIVEIPGTKMRLEGTLDGFALDEETGAIYVIERKTYENRPKLEDLENNEQFTGYTWILSRLFPDYQIGGVLYDGLWKRGLHMARGKERKLDELFTRRHLLKSQDELEQFEKQLIEVATEIQEGPRIYPNRLWFGCWDDKRYEPLCAATMKGEDAEWLLEENYTTRKPKDYYLEDEEE